MWILKNLLTTGCLVYPVKLTCFNNFKWTNLDEVQRISSDSEIWSKGWPEYTNFQNNNNLQIDSKKFLENFNWVKFWSFVHFKYILKILLPYFLLLIIMFILCFYFLKKKELNPIEKKIKLLLVILLITIILWFLKTPIYRYGYSYIISFISLFFACIFSIIFRKKL